VQITGPDYVDPLGYYSVNRSKFPSTAAYAQATFNATAKLRFAAGVRFTADHKDTSSIVFTSGCVGNYLQEYTTGTGACWAPGPDANTWASASRTWRHVDPRFEVDYQWTPALMTYASYSSGYQSGGFNTTPTPGQPANSPYEQETIPSYELGLKSEWFDRRLRLNVAGFYQKFFNYQSSVLHLYNGVDVRTTTSAANAHEAGVELEADARPIPAMGLHGSFAFLDQAYDKIFAGATGLTLQTAINSAPKYAYSLSGDYGFDVGQGRLVLAADWRWVGTKASGTAPAQVFTPPYGILGGNLTYTPPTAKWNLSLWAKNLLNTYYYNAYSSGLNTGIGLTTVTPGAPREFGATVTYNFE
jgi:iron complex outermembrane receptor protein